MISLKQYVMESLADMYINESEIKNSDEFKEYAQTILKNVHKDKYDSEVAKETIDSILKGADGNMETAVNMLQASLEEK